MYRCVILLKNGNMLPNNLPSKEDCDTWILETMEKEDIKKAIIVNKDNIKERYIENF